MLCPALATQRTAAHQAPLSMGFPSQEHWSGLLFPSPGDLFNPGMEPRSPELEVDSLPLSHQGSPEKAWPCQKLDFGCLASRNVRINFCCFISPNLGYFDTEAPRNKCNIFIPKGLHSVIHCCTTCRVKLTSCSTC